MKRLLPALLGLFAAAPVWAQESALEQAQAAQVEAVRKEVADQLQLRAYDLLDELVYGWTQGPPFPTDTPVILADVTVPLGFGSGLQALLENHFIEGVTRNRASHVVLAHCPACTAVTVHSGASGTLVARGVDSPDTLKRASTLSGAHHALFLDFEVEGASLVLRSRITALEPALPIVFAKTLSSATSSAVLLRSPERLKSAPEARKEYLDVLEGRGVTLVPLHLGLRSYGVNHSNAAGVAPLPFVWLEGGAELSLSQARAWTAGISAGVSWAPQMHTAFLLQGRVSRLLSGSVSSLSHPDLYAFLGGSVLSIHGADAVSFLGQTPTLDAVRAAVTANNPPVTTLAAFQVGLELRLKNRFGVGAFLETLPGIPSDALIGSAVDLGIIQFQSFGVEVTLCF